MDSSLLLLPAHLLDRVKEILASDVDLPQNIRRDLQQTVQTAQERASPLLVKKSSDGQDPQRSSDKSDEAGELSDEADSPATIEIDLVDRLAKWSSTSEGQKRIRKAKLDPSDYTLISLLAGTQVYIPPAKLAILELANNPDKPNPYLPSHLSPRSAPLSGLKALNKQISTILNIAFSIFGSGGAVYVAATTGAGYSREWGVLLGVLGGSVVGIAEIILISIFVWRVGEGRKREVEQWKGSSGDGFKDAEGEMEMEGDEEGEVRLIDGHGGLEPKSKPTVRLRRRVIEKKIE